jgi:DNA-binding transcriptional LysR family regulator
MVGIHASATGGVLPLEFVINGKLSNITLPSLMTVTAADSYYAAGEPGLGLIQAPRYRAEADLRSGRLFEVLPGFPPSATPVSVLYPGSRQLSPRVRVH